MPEDEDKLIIYEDDMDDEIGEDPTSGQVVEEEQNSPKKKPSKRESSFFPRKERSSSKKKQTPSASHLPNPKGMGNNRKGSMPVSNPSSQVGKNNVGKNTLRENGLVAQPNQSAISKEKEKNQHGLQEQIKKNAIRSIANVLAPGVGGKVTDALSHLGKKKKSSPFGGGDKDGHKKANDMSNLIAGTFFGKKKLLMTLIPVISIILVIVIVVAVVGNSNSNFKDLVGVGAGGVAADIFGASGGDKDLENLYQRILDVQEEYEQNGKKFAPELIAAVFHVLSLRDRSFSTTDMSDDVIREVADYMFSSNCSEGSCTYSESTFRDHLTNQFFPKYLKESECSTATEEVFQYINDYYALIGYNSTTTGGMCSMSGNTQVNDINGGSFEQCVEILGPIANQVYANTGIFASVTLAQAIVESGCGKHTPPNSNNIWGIKCSGSARSPSTWDGSCTVPVSTSEEVNGGLITIKSAFRKYKNLEEGVLDHATFLLGPRYVSKKVPEATNPYDQIERIKAAGYATDSSYVKKIVNTIKKYNLELWDTKSYSTCSTASSGSYASWLQYDAQWKNIHLGESSATIGSAGCLSTSIAMLVAKSGAATLVNGDFNPKTFVEALNSNNGYTNSGNLNWTIVSKVVPSFIYQGQVTLSGKSEQEKLTLIKQYFDQGYAVVVEVKGNTGQHWVAVDSIQGSSIIMMDPASNATNMWEQYDSKNTSRFGYYKIG